MYISMGVKVLQDPLYLDDRVGDPSQRGGCLAWNAIMQAVAWAVRSEQ